MDRISRVVVYIIQAACLVAALVLAYRVEAQEAPMAAFGIKET